MALQVTVHDNAFCFFIPALFCTLFLTTFFSTIVLHRAATHGALTLKTLSMSTAASYGQRALIFSWIVSERNLRSFAKGTLEVMNCET